MYDLHIFADYFLLGERLFSKNIRITAETLDINASDFI